jgi:hypothetical protein
VEITASSNDAAPGIPNLENDRSTAYSAPTRSFLATSHDGGDEGKIIVVKISRRRYDECLIEFSKASLTNGGTPPH